MKWEQDGITLHLGDCRAILPTLPERSVNCCVTSPPYFGLRDYGHDDQIGLEQTPDEYVTQMVSVFREVRRVLKDDGTLWLNLGDSYGRGERVNNPNDATRGRTGNTGQVAAVTSGGYGQGAVIANKQLIGIPWRVAFALQSDGWFLRQDIIWHKPNPMPESVTDRCTKAHEYIFLLSKSARYYYDADAIKEQAETQPHAAGYVGGEEYAVGPMSRGGHSQREGDQTRVWGGDGKRNRRSVWTVATKSYKGAHFATFPPELIAPCIMAGCPEGGTVLDPFTGSGTTAEVAQKNGCKFVGCELNPEYVELIKSRFSQRSFLLEV